MHAKHIPFETIQRIIQFAAGKPELEYKEWKSQLQFLGISRAWREAAMPVVYRTIFVDIYKNSNLSGGGLRVEGLSEDVSLVSNLSLSRDYVPRNIVRCIQIRTFTHIDAEHALEAVTGHLNLAQTKWLNVRNLNLNLSFKYTSAAVSAKEKVSTITKAKEYARMFLSALPRVSHIKTLDITNSDFCNTLISMLFSGYAHQLVKFKGNLEIGSAVPRLYDGIKELDLRFNAKSEQKMLHICTDYIQSLVLRNIPYDFMPNAFYSHNMGGVLKFEHLKKLDLVYSNDDSQLGYSLSASMSDTGVHFPKLNEFSVNVCPAVCSLLASATFPTSIEFINLSFSPGLYVMLVEAKLRPGEWKELATLLATPTEIGFNVRAVNYLLGTLDCMLYSALVIRRSMQMPDLDNICWKKVKELIVETLIQPREMVQLVQSLSEIVELDVLEVNTEGDSPQDLPSTNIGEDGWTTLTPLNTSIKRLRFGYHMGRYSVEKVGSFLVYLMLRMPQLKSVIAPSRLHVYIDKAKELAQFYPHVASVHKYS